MKGKGIVRLLILFFVIWGFWKFATHYEPTYEDRKWEADKAARAEYRVYVEEVKRTIAEQLLKELRLVYFGDSGSMQGKVEEIGMQFKTYRRATVDEARALHLFVMNKIVEAINAHEKIQPFLAERPFTYKRVSVAIAFEGPYGRYSDGTVGRTSNVTDLAGAVENRNRIFYDSVDPFTGDHPDLFDESHEEAVKLALASPIQNLAVHQTTPLEEAVDEVLPIYLYDMKKEHRFECYSMGGKMTDRVEEIGANFTVVQRATQEQARKLMVLATDRLLEAVNTDEKLRPFLAEYPFPASRVKMRISFVKKNYYSYSDGSVESAVLKDSEISYLKLHLKEEPPLDPHYFKESYQEATQLYKETFSEKKAI